MDSVRLICGKLLETLQHVATARYALMTIIFGFKHFNNNNSECNLQDVDKKCPMALNEMIVKCVTVLCSQQKVT